LVISFVYLLGPVSKQDGTSFKMNKGRNGNLGVFHSQFAPSNKLGVEYVFMLCQLHGPQAKFVRAIEIPESELRCWKGKPTGDGRFIGSSLPRNVRLASAVFDAGRDAGLSELSLSSRPDRFGFSVGTTSYDMLVPPNIRMLVQGAAGDSFTISNAFKAWMVDGFSVVQTWITVLWAMVGQVGVDLTNSVMGLSPACKFSVEASFIVSISLDNHMEDVYNCFVKENCLVGSECD
jgi:hypothetical protein